MYSIDYYKKIADAIKPNTCGYLGIGLRTKSIKSIPILCLKPKTLSIISNPLSRLHNYIAGGTGAVTLAGIAGGVVDWIYLLYKKRICRKAFYRERVKE